MVDDVYVDVWYISKLRTEELLELIGGRGDFRKLLCLMESIAPML